MKMMHSPAMMTNGVGRDMVAQINFHKSAYLLKGLSEIQSYRIYDKKCGKHAVICLIGNEI